MEEFVDILDENGNFTGTILPKTEAHRLGFFHPTIHIWFYTQQGQLLLQKRSMAKKTFPGLWDVSVAGHVSSGEGIVHSALREAKEELGIKVHKDELEKIGLHKCITKHSETLIDCEFHHIFMYKFNNRLSELTLQASEVDAVKLIPISEFKKKIEHPKKTDKLVILDKAYYKLLFNAIKGKL